MKLGRLPLFVNLLGIALFAAGGLEADNCVGGITPHCSGPGTYRCTIPATTFTMSVSCSPTCQAPGQTPAPPAINVGPSGQCGFGMGWPDCPPTFDYITSFQGMTSATYSVTGISLGSALGGCWETNRVTQESVCKTVCSSC